MAGMKINSKKAGLAPGTLVFTGERRRETPDVGIMEFNAENFREITDNLDEYLGLPDENLVRWINIDGVHDVGLLEKTGKSYGLHPLVMEDILNITQRPKIEDYGEYIYIVCKMIYFLPDGTGPIFEQESIVLGKNFLLTFGERKGDVFEPVRERLRNSAGKIRKHGADYLAYALLDSIVDAYFVVLEKIGDQIEGLDERIVEKPANDIVFEIRKLKKDMLYLHKAIWPMREVFGELERYDGALVGKGTKYFLRDAYDHTIQCMDTTETYRDILSGMMDIYLSSISNRMNEIMKVLTIISTLFIPLTFIAGIYGMNFQNMPELSWKWGYFAVLALMAAVVCTMLLYFKRKKWF